jgi:hypothetical protein
MSHELHKEELAEWIAMKNEGALGKTYCRIDFLDRPIEIVSTRTFTKVGGPALREKIGYYVDTLDEKKASTFEMVEWTQAYEDYVTNILDGVTTP